jgi:nucleotide-binding universal stress UspA family protein
MYQRILVPLDGSHTSTRGLQEAVKLAAALHAALRVLHVVDESVVTMSADIGTVGMADILDSFVKSGRQIVRNGIALAERHGIRAESAMHESMTVRVADVILQEAKDWKADLIVMGTHGRKGLTHAVMGSDAETVLRRSPVPVLLVRAPD